MRPILGLLCGVRSSVAVRTDIVHGALFKTFGAIRDRSLGTVRGRLSGWMLLGSDPASLGVCRSQRGCGITTVTPALPRRTLLPLHLSSMAQNCRAGGHRDAVQPRPAERLAA